MSEQPIHHDFVRKHNKDDRESMMGVFLSERGPSDMFVDPINLDEDSQEESGDADVESNAESPT